MLSKVSKIDALKCAGCNGHLRPICALNDKDSIRRYLKGVDLEYDPPPRRPLQISQTALEFDE